MRAKGDAALLELTERFDRVSPRRAAELAVTPAEFDAAERALGDATVASLRYAAGASRAFTRRARRARGMTDEQRRAARPGHPAARRVGVYVPGGRAAYPSTVLMTVVPARVAGVDEIVLVSPPGPASRRRCAPRGAPSPA